MEQHCSKPKLPTEKDGPGSRSSKMAEVKEEFCKSISDLVSTTVSEGAKVPGGHGVALTCYACSNDDTYHHLVAMHLNLQWDCGIGFEFINGYLSKIREHVESHQKKRSRE